MYCSEVEAVGLCLFGDAECPEMVAQRVGVAASQVVDVADLGARRRGGDRIGLVLLLQGEGSLVAVEGLRKLATSAAGEPCSVVAKRFFMRLA